MDQSEDFIRYYRFGDDAPTRLRQFFRDEPV